MCCSIYVNRICLNAWDLFKIEVFCCVCVFFFSSIFFFSFSWSLCIIIALVVQERAASIWDLAITKAHGSSSSHPSYSSRFSKLPSLTLLLSLAEILCTSKIKQF